MGIRSSCCRLRRASYVRCFWGLNCHFPTWIGCLFLRSLPALWQNRPWFPSHLEDLQRDTPQFAAACQSFSHFSVISSHLLHEAASFLPKHQLSPRQSLGARMKEEYFPRGNLFSSFSLHMHLPGANITSPTEVTGEQKQSIWEGTH